VVSLIKVLFSLFVYLDIFAVVEKVQTSNGPAYKIEIGQKPAVPPYPPFFSDPPVFPINAQSRNLFLTKLINAERTTITHVPIFRANMAITREALIGDIIKTYTSKKPGVKKPTEANAATTNEEHPDEKPNDTASEANTSNTEVAENAAPENIDYDKLEEQILLALCAQNKIKYTNINNAVEQLAIHYFGANSK